MNAINQTLQANKAMFLCLSSQERTLGLDKIVAQWSSFFNLKVRFWNLTQSSFKVLNQTSRLSHDSTDDSWLASKLIEKKPSPSLLEKQAGKKNFDDIINILIDTYTAKKPGIYVLENIDPLISSNTLDIFQQQQLKTWLLKITARFHRETDYYLVLLGSDTLEWKLQNVLPRVSLPYVSIEDVIRLLTKKFAELALENHEKTHMIAKAGHILLGLTEPELLWGIETIANTHEINSVDEYLLALLKYKQNKLRDLGLEFLPPPDTGEIGGMDLLKEKIRQVENEFAPEARKYNIPIPKGWLLAGVPGSGKSYVAKVMQQKLRLPMIYISIDSVKSKGSAYLSWVLKRIEAAAPNLVYFDEFDKLFPKQKDSVTMEILGVLLTWLQEKKSHSFVIATLNRLDALPPEITRAGRFDEVFYVGFPQPSERREIFKIHLKRFDRRYREGFDLSLEKWVMLLNCTINFTGAEIASIVEKTQRYLYDQKKKREEKIEQRIAKCKQTITTWIDPVYFARQNERYTLNFYEIQFDVASNPEILECYSYKRLIKWLEYMKFLDRKIEQIKQEEINIEFTKLFYFAKKEIPVFKRDGEGVAAIENRAKDVCVPVSSKDKSGLLDNDGTYWPDKEKVDINRIEQQSLQENLVNLSIKDPVLSEEEKSAIAALELSEAEKKDIEENGWADF